MCSVVEEISKIGIVPVVTLDNVEDAKPLANALCKGGLPCAEVTFRTDSAEESIKIMSDEFPEMLVGAGTVLTKEQVDKAVNAGAKFIVSPGLNPKIVKYCQDKGVIILPGITSPSDIEKALDLGLEVVKFFPAEQSGGIEMIKAMSAPYTKIKFMPTGGVNLNNMKNYLDFRRVIACGGSWMVKKDIIAKKDFCEITKLTKEAVSKMLGLEIKYMDIYDVNSEKNNLKEFFDCLLCSSKNENNERGTIGHIGISTNYIDRAIYHLERQGFLFEKDSIEYDDKSNIKKIYLKGEIGGMALHLFQK